MEQISKKLFDYCVRSNYEGYDPFDGLNSRLFNGLGFQRSAFLRLAWIQFFKRSFIDFRPLTGVPKQFNPKAGALFLSGALLHAQRAGNSDYQNACPALLGLLKSSMIKTKTGLAWGYNFDWQARAFFVPKGTPNIVTTVYVGNALVDYYKFSNEKTIELAIKGARDFILNEMILWEKADSLCFAYIPGKKTEVHNANLWAAAFLSRTDEIWPEANTKEKIRKALTFSVSDIDQEGHWPYGTASHHRWMDNFHTGFNLEALMMIRQNLKCTDYDAIVKKVYGYYTVHFFEKDGAPRYYSNKTYPIDIHNIAESLILFSKVINDASGIFNAPDKEEALKLRALIMDYAVKNFWDKRGYFYYQKGRYFTNRISYLRWSQAWMYYALSIYGEE